MKREVKYTKNEKSKPWGETKEMENCKGE